MKKRFTRILAALALLVFMMPSLVAWGQQYMLVKNISELSQGDVILITNAKADGSNYALGTTQNTNNRKAESVSISNETISTLGNAQEITLETKNGDGYFTFQVGTSNYLYAASSSANQLKTRSTEAYWQVTINTTSYVAAVTDMTNSSNRNKMKYNANNGNPIFSCYTSADNNLFVFKKTTGGSTTVSMPTFSPANGTTFEETLQVTLSQADNKDIYYNINSESDPNANSTHYTGPFSISATSTIKAIAIDGENTSSVATATYTKLVYNNIEDIVANQTQYTVKGTVVATNNRGFVIGDGTGYVYTYLNSVPSQSIGDKVRISGSTGSYGHILQFTSSATITTSTTSNYDGTPAIVTVDETAMAGYNSDYQLSDYVQYEGTLTKSTSNNNTYYNIAVGSATARISYQTTAQANQLEALLNKTVKVKGYFAGFSSSIFTTMMESVEEVVSTEPVLSVNPTSLSFTYTQGATEVPTESFSIIGSNLTDDVTVTLPSNYAMYDAETGDPISSPYTLTPEDGVINTTLVVELNSGLQQGSYNGSITIAWEGEEDLTVALTGTVTEPEPENVTWDLTTATYNSASAEQVQWTSNYATMTVDKNGASSNANAYLNSGNPVTTRFYNGQKLTFAVEEGYEIDHVVITGQSGYVAGLNIENWTNASAMADGNVVTVTPTNGNNPFFVIINATIRLTSVTVYYAESTATFYDINIDDTMENGTVVANPIEATEGTMVTLTIFPAAGYYLEENNIMVDVTGVEVTKVNAATYTFTMPANDVTVSAVFSEYTGTYYTLVTSADQLVAGRHYIIASSKTGGAAYAMGAQTNSTYRDQVETVVVGTMIYETEGVSEIVLNQAASNLWVLYDEEKPGYLYASSVSNNNLGTRAFNNANNPERGQWAISFSDGVANIVSQIEGENIPNTIRYNAGSSRFSCYPGTQAPVYLYLKANETNYTYVKDVNAYEGEGGYVLVASPVSTTPEAAGMITDTEGANATPETATYDLYSFDQAQELEWINYRRGAFNTIEPGKGYLYASKNGTTLTFAGEPSTTSTATLSLSGNGEFAGWNLVGNPFSVPAYIGNRAYYRIGNGGADIVAATAGTAIDVMEGIFVIATENNEVLNFSTTASKGASVAMNVVRERGNIIDRAIVRFDEGDQLPKFQLNKNHTKVYISMDGEDYAVVRGEEMGEMPVSFKAENNGSYTLTVNTEELDMNYLHLIDNMTGNDIDLLQTPSYSFEAKTTDYESRFKLVFATGDNSNDDNFAFYSNGSFVINNEGNATLQVIDIMGRIVKSESINGCANVNVNGAAGVYMLRLVNGDNVKVQKVVVK